MRGTGRTTEQMKEAPKDAVFVWCNSHTQYPLMLAHRLGRHDLQIVSPHWLNDYRYVGKSLTGIVVDHALWDMLLTADQRDRLQYHIERAKTFVRMPATRV